MMNVQMLAAKVGVSLVAVGSLAVVGTGVAGAVSHDGTAASTAAASQRASSDAKFLCERREAILQGMTQARERLAASRSIFEGLAATARASGNTKRAQFWVRVVQHRDRDIETRDVNIAVRRAHFTALDHAGGSC